MFLIGVLSVLSVSAASDLTILNPPAPFTADVTDTINGTFTLNNTGTENLTGITFTKTQFTGSRVNLLSSIISFSPPNVALLNTTELRLVNFTVSLAGTNAFADIYTSTINATASEPGNFDTFLLTVTVKPNPNATLTNATISNAPEGFSRGTSFTLSNTGNTDLDVNLSVSDLTSNSDTIGLGNIILEKNSTSLLYGTSESLNVTVSVPSDQTTGTYTGTITALFNGGNTTSTLTVTVVERKLDFTLTPSPFNLTGQLNSTIKGIFFVENTGNLPITNMNVVVEGLSQFNVQFDETNFNLSLGEKKNIGVNATIPIDITVKTYTGTITVTDGTVSKTLSLKFRVKSNLEINDLDVEIDNRVDNNLEDGDTITEDAESGSLVEFDIKIKNLFDRSVADRVSDIDNILITITIFDIDDGDDLEEESEEFDLEAGQSRRKIVTFRFPEELEEDTYDVEVLVEGKDGNGIEHQEIINLFLRVDRDSHEIIINIYNFDPEIVTCEDKTTLSLELKNIGSTDDDDVAYKIENSLLGLKIVELVPYELDSDYEDDDNTYDAQHTINIPSDIAPGTYKLEARVYYDFDKISTLKEIFLIIGRCDSDVMEEEMEAEEEAVEEEEEELEESGTVIRDVSKGKFKTSPTFIATVAAAVLIVLGGISLIIIRLNK